jgi:hypothetical protein
MRNVGFAIDPPLRIRAGVDRSLSSIEEAIDFLNTWPGRRAGPDWGKVLCLLEAVRTPEQIAGATTALRALLERDNLLLD